MKFAASIVMYMKRCIQNNIFILMADHVNIIIFGGLGCIWCHLSIGKCVQKLCTEKYDIFFHISS